MEIQGVDTGCGINHRDADILDDVNRTTDCRCAEMTNQGEDLVFFDQLLGVSDAGSLVKTVIISDEAQGAAGNATFVVDAFKDSHDACIER